MNTALSRVLGGPFSRALSTLEEAGEWALLMSFYSDPIVCLGEGIGCIFLRIKLAKFTLVDHMRELKHKLSL